MAATIVHFGVDSAIRVPVLKSAGFEVDVCSSVDSLIEELERRHVDAVVLPDKSAENLDSIVTFARWRPSTSVVVFEEVPDQPDDAKFDLVVPVFTPPQKWLADIAQLIAESKAARADAQSLRARSSKLREEMKAVELRVWEQCELSAKLTQRFSEKIGSLEAWWELVRRATDEQLLAFRNAGCPGLRQDDERWRLLIVEDELQRRGISN
jgi:hypothetical protein